MRPETGQTVRVYGAYLAGFKAALRIFAVKSTMGITFWYGMRVGPITASTPST